MTVGEVTVTPPLKWADVKNSDFLTGDSRASGRKLGQSLVFEIDKTVHETDEGEVTVKTVSMIVPLWGGKGASGYLASNMREIMHAHPGHVFKGEFITYPETGMHAFPTRVLVTGSVVLEQTAEVTWVTQK
jgi:hypothetical protein